MAPTPSQRATSFLVVVVRIAVAAVAAWVTGSALGRALATVGATDAEVASSLPGDATIGPDGTAGGTVTTRATSVAASPAAVWPWLVQLGWGRAGWYAVDVLERPAGAARSVAQDGTVSWRSLTTIAPRHQQLAVGDDVPLGEGIGLRVTALQPEQHLVLELDRLIADVRFRWIWTFAVQPVGEESSRLVVRTRIATDPPAVERAIRPVLDPGHAVMELAQLRGIRDRAEGRLA